MPEHVLHHLHIRAGGDGQRCSCVAQRVRVHAIEADGLGRFGQDEALEALRTERLQDDPFPRAEMREIAALKLDDDEQAVILVTSVLLYSCHVGTPQASAVRVYGYIEDWWGDVLTVDLLRRMIESPRRHLKRFIHMWPSDSELLRDSSAHIPQLLPGELRPTFGNPASTQHLTSAGIGLLLYTPSIILDFDYLTPFRGDNSQPWKSGRAGWRYLAWLAAIRPLALDGSVYFANRMDAVIYHGSEFLELLMKQPPSIWNPHDPFISEAIRNDSIIRATTLNQPPGRSIVENFTYASNLAANLGLAADGLATPIALNGDDRTAYSIAASNMRAVDGRIGNLSTLLRVQVPNINLDLSEIVALRGSSDAFFTWRTALANSLSLVQGLPDGEDSLGDARSLLTNELQQSLEMVFREARRSPSLASVARGWRGFTLAGLGAGVPVAAVGDPVQSAVAAATGAAMGGALDAYFSQRRARREGKAILDVYGWFLESIDPEV